jgi:hypothetical protein
MAKRFEDKAPGAPIPSGVLIERDGGQGDALVSPKGQLIFDKARVRPVMSLIFDTLRAAGHKVPAKLCPSLVEIFYARGRVSEVRVFGLLPHDIKRNVYPPWGVGAETGFDLTPDLRLIMAPEDVDRAHLAAIRQGPLYIISWDLGANGHAAGAKPLRIRLPREKPVTANDKYDEARYGLAIHFAQTIATSAERIRTVLDKMKDGKHPHDSEHRMALSHAFSLWERDGGANGERPLRIRRMGLRDLKWSVLDAVLQLAKHALDMEPGRPQRAGVKRRSAAAKGKKGLRREDILRGVRLVFEDARRDYGEVRAVDMVSKKAVAEVLGCARSTLYACLKRERINFDRLVSKVVDARSL